MADPLRQQRCGELRRREFVAAGLWIAAISATFFRQNRSSGARTFDITMQIDVVDAHAPVRLWLPLPLTRATPYQRSLAQTWTSDTQQVELRGGENEPPMLVAWWSDATVGPALTLNLQVSTTPYRVSPDQPGAREPRSALERYLQPTTLIPTDGIVREKAQMIVAGHRTPLARARAIYEWIVENTFRDPDVKGCGLGDIRWMLESGSLGGKCADLNALFVGLCRSIGLPARDLYGLRVGASREFRSLGRSGDVTAAQHCRAEVYVDDLGWVPVDPADVRKVGLEEDAGATLASAPVARARERLFGSWEMNWIAFNDAHDVVLPGSSGRPLPFLMYPQVEVGGVRRDSLDAAHFRYAIRASEVSR